MEEDWERPPPEKLASVKKQLGNSKVKEECWGNEGMNGRDGKDIAARIFDEFWVGRGHGENKGSETSGSSQSPPTSAKPGEAKSSGISSMLCFVSIVFFLVGWNFLTFCIEKG